MGTRQRTESPSCASPTFSLERWQIGGPTTVVEGGRGGRREKRELVRESEGGQMEIERWERVGRGGRVHRT